MSYELVIRSVSADQSANGRGLALDGDDPDTVGDVVSAVLAMMQSMDRARRPGQESAVDMGRAQLSSLAAVLDGEAERLEVGHGDVVEYRVRADSSARILRVAAVELAEWARGGIAADVPTRAGG